jgi:hypothetical protein
MAEICQTSSLSDITLSNHPQIKWTPPLTAVFQTFAALIDTMSAARVKTYLKHVCEPMYRVLDESGGLIARPGDAELGQFGLELLHPCPLLKPPAIV